MKVSTEKRCVQVVSSYYYICVLILLYVSSSYYVCVLVLLCMCPHTTLYVRMRGSCCTGSACTICTSEVFFFLQVVRMRGSCCTSSTCTICTSNSSFDSNSGNRGRLRPAVANEVAASWSWSCCTSSACTICTSKALATAALTTSSAVEGGFRGLRQQQQTREY